MYCFEILIIEIVILDLAIYQFLNEARDTLLPKLANRNQVQIPLLEQCLSDIAGCPAHLLLMGM